MRCSKISRLCTVIHDMQDTETHDPFKEALGMVVGMGRLATHKVPCPDYPDSEHMFWLVVWLTGLGFIGLKPPKA